jgi:hypothetical protein
MKTRPEEAKRTDNNELIVAFHNFSNAPKNPVIIQKLLFVFTHNFIFEITPIFFLKQLSEIMYEIRTNFLRV